MAYQDVLATRLRMERSRIKQTQRQVEEATGVSQGGLSAYENGTKVPTLQVLTCLADYYGASLDYLTGRD